MTSAVAVVVFGYLIRNLQGQFMIKDIDFLKNIITNSKSSPSPEKRSYGVPHTDFIIAIGNDHHATITIDNEALEVLNSQELNVVDPKTESEAVDEAV